MTATAKLTEIRPALLKISDAARYLAMSDSSFRGLIREGEIQTLRINSDAVVRVSDLDALIERFAERSA